MKSFRPKDGSNDEPPPDSGRNAEVDFKGQKRSNETHASTADPEATIYRKGPGMEARLAYLGHALMENRSGLIVNACLTPADGHGERNAALAMIEPPANRRTGITLGADKGYDARVFVKGSRFIQGAGAVDITLIRKFGNWGLTMAVRTLYGGSFSDLCYGYVAFWKRCFPFCARTVPVSKSKQS